jgi:hypothetical protein
MKACVDVDDVCALRATGGRLGGQSAAAKTAVSLEELALCAGNGARAGGGRAGNGARAGGEYSRDAARAGRKYSGDAARAGGGYAGDGATAGGAATVFLKAGDWNKSVNAVIDCTISVVRASSSAFDTAFMVTGLGDDKRSTAAITSAPNTTEPMTIPKTAPTCKQT